MAGNMSVVPTIEGISAVTLVTRDMARAVRFYQDLGFSLTQISPLDPSGWMRVVLMPNGQPINLQARPASAVPPQPGPNPTAAVTPNVAR